VQRARTRGSAEKKPLTRCEAIETISDQGLAALGWPGSQATWVRRYNYLIFQEDVTFFTFSVENPLVNQPINPFVCLDASDLLKK
jgi:hypothetical protein